MSLLVIQLPARVRGAAPAAAPAEYAYAYSVDGRVVTRHGCVPARELPRADQCCAVLDDADLAWQQVTLPKAPAARLRDALGAVLEDQLLQEPEELHLALEPGATAGQPAWVAVMQRDWLRLLVADLEAGGVVLQRLLPLAWPHPLPHLHVMPAARDGDAPVMVMGHAGGVTRLVLRGSLARQQLDRLGATELPCSAHPSVVTEAERWLGAPLTALSDAERALQAAHTGWNLLQFDLAPRHRGWRALGGLRALASAPGWRPVRIALAAAVAVQLLGINLWAWHQQRQLTERRQQMVRLLQDTHPQVRAVLDAPVQMQRETDRLRAASGKPGPSDLEPMLAAAAAAWPDGQGPMTALRFEPGRLTLSAPGWNDDQRARFTEQARATGYQAEGKGDQMVLSRTERT